MDRWQTQRRGGNGGTHGFMLCAWQTARVRHEDGWRAGNFSDLVHGLCVVVNKIKLFRIKCLWRNCRKDEAGLSGSHQDAKKEAPCAPAVGAAREVAMPV